MSNVDERIVSMKFDDTGFEAGATKAIDILDKLKDTLKFDGAESGVENLKKSLSGFDTNGVSSSLDTVKGGFSALEQVGIGALRRLGEEVTNLGMKLLRDLGNNLTKGAKDGFDEYQMMINSIQTISANSGEEMSVIKENLDELNTYADKTIYVFSEMTANIGRFTAAGIDVKTSTNAIKGFSNMAALAGAGSQETARGMYQLSQAMAAGVVKLQDWRSIQNASIDTAAFKDILIETGRAMNMPVDEAIKKQGSFTASLTEGWLTVDVMSQALQVATMSTRDFADEEEGMAQRMKELSAMGYSEDVAKKLIGIANAADDSAREVRTFKQLMDTVEEGIGSGWTETWELIIGDFDQATELFTTVSNRLDSVIQASANARNNLLKDWGDRGGRNALIGSVANIVEAIVRIVDPIRDAFGDVFSITGKQLARLTENFARFTQKLVITEDTMGDIYDVFHSVFSIIHSFFGILGNGIRFVVGYFSLFTHGFFDVKSVFLSINDILGPFAQWMNKIHAATDKAVNGFSDMVYTVTHLWQILASGDESAKTAEEALSSPLRKIVTMGSDVHLTILHLVGAVKNVIKFMAVLARSVWVVIAPLRELLKIIGSSLLFTVLPAIAAKLREVSSGFSDFVRNVTDVASRMLKPIRRIYTEVYKLVGRFAKAFVSVFTESDFFKTISGWFEKIQSFVSGLFPNLAPDGKLFGHTIAYYFIHPFKTLKDILVDFNKDHRVKFFKEWLRGIADIMGGPFNAAFGIAKWLIEKVANIISGPLANAVHSVHDWFSGLDLANPFGAIAELLSSVKITNPFEGFEIPESVWTVIDNLKTKITAPFENFDIPAIISSKIEELKTKFIELGTSTDGATWSIGEFIKECGKKIKTSGRNKLDWVVSNLSSAWSNLKNYFKDLQTNGNSFGQNVRKVFGDVYHSLSDWVHRIAEGTEGFGGAIAGAFAYILDQLEKVPDLIRSLFGNAKTATDEGVKSVTDTANNFQNEQKTFWENILSNLSNVDIGAGITTFFGGIKDKIVSGFTQLLLGNDGLDATSLRSSLVGIFDFSDFKITLPDFTTPVSDFVDQFAAILDKFPMEKIEDITNRFGGILTNVGKWGFAFSGWKFLNSLTKFNTGLGKEAGGLGDLFSQLPTVVSGGMEGLGKAFGKDAAGSIKDGMTNVGKSLENFGKSFSPFTKKQAISKSFMQVATGILILAGALFVMSRIPADDLERAGEALLKLMALSAGLTFFAAWLSAITKLDLQGVGAAMAGLGIGMLGMAGAIFLFTKMSADPNIVVGMNNFKLVLEELVIAMAILMGMSTLGGSLTGLATTMLTLVTTIGLAVGVIALLGIMPTSMYVVGSDRLEELGIFFTAAVSLIGLISGAAATTTGAMLGAVAAMLGLVTVITLSIVPIMALSAIPEGMFNTGKTRLEDLGIFFGIAATLMSVIARRGMQALLASLALIPFVAAITLASIPVFILGSIPNEKVVQGTKVIGKISILFGAIIAFFALVDANILGIIGAAIGLTLLMVPITMMALVIAALSFVAHQDLESMRAAVETFAIIVAGIAALAITGTVAGVGLLVLAAGIALVAGSFLLLGAAVDAVDFDSMLVKFSSFASGVEEIVWNAFYGMLNALGQAPFILFEAAVNAGKSFLEGLKSPHALNESSPSKATEEAGENAIEGFLNGIANYLSELFGSGEDSGDEFMNGLSDLPSKLADKASEAITTFLDGINVDEIKEKGENITSGLLEGIKGAAWESLQAIPGQIWDAIVQGVKDFFGIQSPSTVMADIGNNIIQGLINGIGDLLGSLGEKAGEIGNTFMTGLGDFAGWLGSKGEEGMEWFIGGIQSLTGQAGAAGADAGASAAGGMDSFANSAGDKGSEGAGKFVKGIAGKVSEVTKSSKSLMDATSNGIKPLGNNMKNSGSDAAKKFISGINSGKGGAKSAANALTSSAKNGLGNLSNKFYSVGRDGAMGFINGIDSKISAAASKAAQLAAAAIKAAKKKLDSHSPSKVFRQIGSDTGAGFIIGMNNSIPAIAKASSNMAAAVPEGFNSVLNSMSLDIEDILDTDYNPEITPVINATRFNSDISSITSALNSRFNGLNVGNLNYTGELSAKLDGYADINRQAVEAIANNAIDYDLLGTAVANALITSGVHVEMDGGKIVGFVAGEVLDVRRTYIR